MFAGVVLLLVLIAPDRSLHAMTQVMPSLEACEDAKSEYLAGEPDAHDIRPEQGSNFRSALCITVPLEGRDA